MKDILIQKINTSNWWHVSPRDQNAYKKRGKFLASTFRQAEFYGRPNDEPERVDIKDPIFGFSELEILIKLFGNKKGKRYSKQVLRARDFYKTRITLDAKMRQRAKEMRYDAIVLMTEQGKKDLLAKENPILLN